MPDPRYVPTPAPRPDPSLFDAQAEPEAEAADRGDDQRAALAEIKAAITVSADDVGRLRRQDVYRVLEWSGDLRAAVANYVREHRPDLHAEVGAALLELERAERVREEGDDVRWQEEAASRERAERASND